MMSLQEQARRGLREALKVQNMSAWKVSVAAGFNQNQVTRFLNGRNDITLGNLERLCRDGLKMPVRKVIGLGK